MLRDVNFHEGKVSECAENVFFRREVRKIRGEKFDDIDKTSVSFYYFLFSLSYKIWLKYMECISVYISFTT